MTFDPARNNPGPDAFVIEMAINHDKATSRATNMSDR